MASRGIVFLWDKCRPSTPPIPLLAVAAALTVETGILAYLAASSKLASFYRTSLVYALLILSSLGAKTLVAGQPASNILHAMSAAVLPLVLAEAACLGRPADKKPRGLVLVSVSAAAMAMFSAWDRMSPAVFIVALAEYTGLLAGEELAVPARNRDPSTMAEPKPAEHPASKRERREKTLLRHCFSLFLLHMLKLWLIASGLVSLDPCGDRGTALVFLFDALQLGWFCLEPVWAYLSGERHPSRDGSRDWALALADALADIAEAVVTRLLGRRIAHAPVS